MPLPRLTEEGEPWSYHGRIAWQANPTFSVRAQRAAWARATQWRNSVNDTEDARTALADVAHSVGLPSGLAARDALVLYQCHRYGYASPYDEEDENTLARIASSDLGWSRYVLDHRHWAVDDADSFIQPQLYDPPYHPEGCGCGECNPCDCEDYHCERCYPEGPAAAGCQCEDCRPAEMDDMGDDDVWPGLPEMPETAPQRTRFGIEIEFNGGNRQFITQALQRQGLAVLDTGYTHEVTRFWKMTTDSSVSGGELVSPVMSGDDHSIELVREAIRVIKLNGGSTARNVGMHVHLDITQFTEPELRVLAANIRRAEKVFASFVPSYRWNGSGENIYAATLIGTAGWREIERWIARIDPSDRARSREHRTNSCPVVRYVSFNFNALLTYGSIECRLLGHTLNTLKVRTWIRTLQTLFEASRLGQQIPSGDALAWLTEFGLEHEYAEHFRSVSTARGNERMLVVA